jgi:hypothetical protein
MKRLVIIFAMVLMFSTTALAADSPVTTGRTQVESRTAVQSSTSTELQYLGSACCIGGKYTGTKQDTVCTPGNKPKAGGFTMEISQIGKCGGKFLATVVDSADGTVTSFGGQVAFTASRECCTIQGDSTSGTDKIHFKGTICKRGLKWEAKGDSDAKNCKGTWEMKQM